MSAIEKILELLPYGDGAIRRRFITGLIFLAVFSANYLIHIRYQQTSPATFTFAQKIGFEPKDLLNSPQTLFVAALIVFAFGTIADAMIDGYIVRGVSISIGVINQLHGLADKWPTPIEGLWWIPILLLAFLFLPLAVLVCTVLNFLGYEKLSTLGLSSGETALSTQARTFYENRLSESMREVIYYLYIDK